MKSQALLKAENKTPLISASLSNKSTTAMLESALESSNRMHNSAGFNFGSIKVHNDATGSSGPGRVQPKLTINQPGDKYEQEADAMAEKVMRMPDPSLNQNKFFTPTISAVQRKCAHCEEEEKKAHRKESSTSSIFAISPAVEQTLQSSGQSMDQSTRSFMEARFGHDFSAVRVHNDYLAHQSSAEINALAYTYKNHIVFGAGKFTPETENGKRLLAHELTHAVQQGGKDHTIHRREINVSVAGGNRNSVANGDWLDLDRREWEMLSQQGTESSLSRTNTFMRAAYYNTLNLRPGEYTTVRERHDYYDLMSYVLEYDKNTPAALRGIRFFHATTAITGTPGIGSVDTAVGYSILQPQTRQLLREVNEELFALNMGVIQNLLFRWHEPRNPRSPTTGAISGFNFDIKMVETEQITVEEYILRNQSRFTSAITQDINNTLDPNAFGQSFNFSKRSFEWAKNALHVQALDFTDITHRRAIGYASVHIFHRKTFSDYESFMRSKIMGDYPVIRRNAG